jgi:ABC-type Fe3+ transport system permease subunit
MTVTPSRVVLGAAWAFPLLVLGQFALLAVVPVAVVLIGARRSRAGRWWSGLLAAAYVIPLALWVFGPDGVPSLSKSMSPAVTAAVAAVGVAVALAHTVRRRPVSRPAPGPTSCR